MLFNVPQFIDVEDRVAGPLTAKQIFWLVGMGGVLFIVWTFFDTPTFFTLAVPIILIFVVFAFYRPYNQSMLTFTVHGLMFFLRPKLYTWDRPGIVKQTPIKPKETSNLPEGPKPLSVDDIRALAQSVDSGRR